MYTFCCFFSLPSCGYLFQSICLSIYLSLSVSIYLCLSVFLSVSPSVHLPIGLPTTTSESCISPLFPVNCGLFVLSDSEFLVFSALSLMCIRLIMIYRNDVPFFPIPCFPIRKMQTVPYLTGN